ncbi:MAG: hypothetical protein V4659_12000 [Pseudomonadota bacterium]
MLTRIAAALVFAVGAAPAHADELQNRVVAAARAAPAERHAYKRTLTLERTGTAKKVIVEQFDPRRPAAAQWTLVSVDGRAPTAKELADARKVKRGANSGYASIAKWFGTPATRTDPAPGSALYRFARLPAGTLKIGSHDASADSQAEALVSTRGATPFVERIRLTSTKGFRMMLVASLKSIDVVSRYRQLPDGGIVPGDSISLIAGSMMGKSGQLKTTVSYSDFHAVR